MTLEKWTNTDLSTLKKLLNQNSEIDFLNLSLNDENLVDKLKLGNKNKEKNIRLLFAYQRLLKIAPKTDLKILGYLLKDGLQSALHIAAIPQQQFLKKYTDTFEGDIAKAIQFYENAKAIKTKVLLKYMNQQQKDKVPF